MPLLVLTLWCACTGKVTDTDDEAVDDADYPPSALVLVMDGVRVEEFTSDFASDLTAVTGEEYARKMWTDVIPQGALVRAAINPGITITAPGHLEMVTGRVEAFANYGVEDAGPGLYRPEYPTVFEATREGLALDAEDVVFLANTELLAPDTWSVYPGLGESLGATYSEVFDPEQPDAPINDDGPVVDALKALIRDRHPRLTVVNLHDVDRAGHYGSDAAYPADVAKLDDRLTEFWRWLGDHQPGYQRDLVVVLTADHGRHRHEDDEGWRNHGDDCSGCREVPMVWFGPGAAAGVELDGTYTLADIGPTVAAHLGVELPYATGLPLTPAFPDLGAAGRSGDVGLFTAAGHTLLTRHRDDFEARSEVVLDGVVVSTPGVFGAESAALAATARGAVACWRELALTPGELYWPWVPRCLEDAGGGWVEIGFPEASVGVNWRPAFATAADGLYAASNHNPDGIGELGVGNEVGLRVHRWVDGRWTTVLTRPDYFPVDPSIVAVEGGFVVAYGTNEADEAARYSRHVVLLRLAPDGDALVVEGERPVQLSPFLGELPRYERARLAVLTDGTVALAVIGLGTETRDVFLVTSDDDGRTWADPVGLGALDPVFAHLGPRWDGDTPVWAALGGDGGALLCAAVDGEVRCGPAGSPRVDSFDVDGGVVRASVDTDVGAWAVGTVTIP